MAKHTKTFGVNKASKRRQKRKKRVSKLSNVVPLSIIPRSEAPAVFQLIEQNRDSSELLISSELKQMMM